MLQNKYTKIAILAAALLLIAIILVFALGRDSALFPSREEETTTTKQEETTPTETTYAPFDDSNIGEWN